MERRAFLGVAIMAMAAGSASRAATVSSDIDVYKNPSCGCCGGWVEHLRANGFSVKVSEVTDTAPYRAKAGIPDSLASCHTAFVGGYALEGHVPAADIKRLFAERPNAKGLVVPGMRPTSPGMNMAQGPAWDVLLLAANGSTRIFHSYPAK